MSLSSPGTFQIEIFEVSKNSKYNDPEDMVYRIQLTYDEIIDLLYLRYIPTSTIGNILPPGTVELSDIVLC